MPKLQIILGSASPRRRELLAPHFRLKFRSPDIDESPRRGEGARAYVRRMAREKWLAVKAKANEYVLTADTTVVHRGRILGKPLSYQEAERMLRKLSGGEHEVITAVCLGYKNSQPKLLLDTTKVCFRKLPTSELQNYLRSGEWKGKAGAYGIQGKASSFVSKISGSLTNVIGLPVERVLQSIQL